ncbi:MAG TPA: hypothetical protein VH661_10685 [Candidatus Dormibacteraeota bacterium]|nr:hypothetical protein [Candidatus Dormibacteraeota bacterium]
MRSRLRLFAAGAALAAVGVAALTGGHALATTAAPTAPSTAAHEDVHGVVLSATLAPSQPTDLPIFGAMAGGVPWSLGHGHVVLRQGGGLSVDVDGLIVTPLGSNPVPGLAASVYCNGMLAATTAPVPFSTTGDADIAATVSLPAFCPAPAVLLNPAVGSPLVAKPGTYIGFDGTR